MTTTWTTKNGPYLWILEYVSPLSNSCLKGKSFPVIINVFTLQEMKWLRGEANDWESHIFTRGCGNGVRFARAPRRSLRCTAKEFLSAYSFMYSTLKKGKIGFRNIWRKWNKTFSQKALTLTWYLIAKLFRKWPKKMPDSTSEKNGSLPKFKSVKNAVGSRARLKAYCKLCKETRALRERIIQAI